MTPLVTGAVLLAAVTHASWNAIAHRITDKLTGFALISGGGMLIGLALLPFTAFPRAAAWPYLLVSAVLHIAYYALLMRSFRLGDFGQAYPIARGSAPCWSPWVPPSSFTRCRTAGRPPGSCWPAPA